MVLLANILLQLLGNAVRFFRVALLPTRMLVAENLFLRRQLALYREHGVKPRRIDIATRVSLTLLSRLFDWRSALFVVRPETIVRWHRAGFRAYSGAGSLGQDGHSSRRSYAG